MWDSASKAMQQTKPAHRSFNICLSHNGSVLWCGSLPVVMARVWLLMAGVREERKKQNSPKYSEKNKRTRRKEEEKYS
jgi:hypothetical protein